MSVPEEISSGNKEEGGQQAKHIQEAFRKGKGVQPKINSRVKQFSLEDRSKRSIFLSVTVPKLELICEIRFDGKSSRVSLSVL